MKVLIEILFIISNALLWPVIVGLLLLLSYSLTYLGGFIAEYINRKKANPYLKILMDEVMQKGKIDNKFLESIAEEKLGGHFKKFIANTKHFSNDVLKIAKVVNDIEIDSLTIVTSSSLGARLGPILGLMGTLIPLGPALVALSVGDISKLAQKLIIAFSTTIVGLLIAGISYFITQVRRRWYLQDLKDIKFIYQCLNKKDGSA